MLNLSALQTVQPLQTPDLQLVPMSEAFLDSVMGGLEHREFMRLTGTHGTFTRPQVEAFLAALPKRQDRADWAILRREGGEYLGEVVLNDLDADNHSMNFRIALNSDEVVGRGYGTQATQAAIRYGFERVGLHRIHLGVLTFNPRAQRVYEKCGFVREGVERDALLWNGEWIDQIRMAMLSTDPRPD